VTHLHFYTKKLRLINKFFSYFTQSYLPLSGIQLLFISTCILLKTSALSAEKAVLIIDYLKDNIPIQQETVQLQRDSSSADYLPVKLQIGNEHTVLFNVKLPQLTNLPEQEMVMLPPKSRPTIQLSNEQANLSEQPLFLPPNNWKKHYFLDHLTSLLLLLYGFIYAIKQGKTYWQAKQKVPIEKIVATIDTKKIPCTSKEEPTKSSAEFSMDEINWLVNLQQTVEQNMSNIHFSIEQLASDLAISSRHLNRRIRQYTGFSTNQYIQETRLTTAKKLLDSQAYKSVKAVAYEVGYKDVKYFGQLFKKRFGHLPSAYFKKNRRRLMIQGV